jgi:hypothetical protein
MVGYIWGHNSTTYVQLGMKDRESLLLPCLEVSCAQIKISSGSHTCAPHCLHTADFIFFRSGCLSIVGPVEHFWKLQYHISVGLFLRYILYQYTHGVGFSVALG